MPRAACIMLLSLAFLTQARAGEQAPRRPAPSRATAAPVSPEHPPVEGSGPKACVSCHAPVSAHRVMHGPAAASCTTCHEIGEANGRRAVTLARGAKKGDTRQLCVSCHEEVGARLRSRHLHAPVAGSDCTSCHDPHGSSFRYQLPEEGNRACLACHTDLAETMAQPFRHGPAEASCTMCHDAHAAPHPAQLRSTTNGLCLACHGEIEADSVPAVPAQVFGPAAAAAHPRLLAEAPHVRLDPLRRRGHPMLNHPVEGPADPVRAGRPFNCTSCHNPHAAGARNLLRYNATGTSPLCVRCHQY